jgi:3-oxoacyl-[acyl-carrier protein] reductase
MGFEDKVIVVAGGTGDLGQSICLVLADKGAKIVFSYAHNEAGAQDLESCLRDTGAEAVAVKAQLQDYTAAEQLMETATTHFGQLDGLVNCAGINHDVDIIRMKLETWEKVLRINLNSVFHCCKAAAWTMIAQKYGSIINVASISGLVGVAQQTNYAASKAGVIGFTKSLSKELGHYGVRVNAVAPGLIESEMVRGIKPAILEQYLKAIPLERLGHAEEVAKAVLFLLSDEASYITGQTIVVDGGFIA